MNRYALGVDGCKAGWISARCEAEELRFVIYPTFAELLAAHPDATIAIDIPIGLTENGEPRLCDVQARRLIGPRRSSIFPAPDRRMLRLAFTSHAEASAWSRKNCGKGISQQLFAIGPKIAEVDDAMTPELQQRVFEVHPELCFWKLAGRHLVHPKRKAEGFNERRVLLGAAFSGVRIPERKEARQFDAAPDDVLDALVALWTAEHKGRNSAEWIPAGPPVDRRGLRMEMIY
jgi:predicted RNase H-like nuclease